MIVTTSAPGRGVRIAAAVVAMLVLWLAAASGARAQDPVAPGAPIANLDQEQHDSQLTHFTVHVQCLASGAACAGTVHLSWQRAALPSYRASGAHKPLGSAPFDLQPGGEAVVTVVVAGPVLRDRLARAAPSAARLLYQATAADGTELGAITSLAYVGTHVACGAPAYVPLTGPATQQVSFNSKPHTEELVSGDLEANTITTATGPVRLRVLGVTYALSSGARFALTCSGLTDYHGGAFFPTLALFAGSVHVTGKPASARQFAVSVFTREGSLGSRSGEDVDFTVAENNAHHTSTMHVSQGYTTQITPTGTSHRSPCTTGQALRVDRRGHITRI